MKKLGWAGLGWAGAGLAILMAAGCDPTTPQTVTAVGTGGATARLTADSEGDNSLGAAELSAVIGPVAELRYTLDTEKRLYLIRGDLNARIDSMSGSIATLRFPRSPDTSAERVVRVIRDQNWMSLRVYDLGLCSLFMPWFQLNPILNGLLQRAVDMDPTISGPNSVGGAPTRQLTSGRSSCEAGAGTGSTSFATTARSRSAAPPDARRP